MYASEDDEGLSCGDGAEVERGVGGDVSFTSRGRENASEGLWVAVLRWAGSSDER